MQSPLAMTDFQLISLFLRYRDEGDVAGLAELFDALSPELLRVARHVAFDTAEAEDLVQAAFLTAMEHPERFDESRSVSAWLVGIVSKEALSWRRSAARRPDPERLTEGAVAREVNERPEAKAVDAETWSLLDAALARLPERYRDVLERHLRRGQSPSQIAEEKKASPATVRVQLHRGMAQLRQWIPAGAAGAFALTLSERGLAAVRAELVAHAKTLPLSTAGAVGGGSAAGAGALSSLLMLQRVALGAIALVVLVFLGRQVLISDRAEIPPAIVVSPTISGPVFEERPASDEENEARVSLGSEGASSGESEKVTRVQRLVIETLWHDGSVAPRVGFDYIVWTDGEDVHGSSKTDDQGLVRLTDLPAGHVSLYGDFGGTASAQLLEFKTSKDALESLDQDIENFTMQRVVWTLPQGIDVTGRVVNAMGQGVAGASLWVTTGMNRDSGRIVRTSSADGSFFLPQLQNGCLFGARADSYGPSKPEHVQYWSERANEGEAIDLTLTLGEAAASLSGRVVDHEGSPASGARVRLGAQASYDTFGPTGAEGPPPPIEVLTDENGEFEASGLAPGKVEWACQFEGHAVKAGVLQVPSGETGRLLIELRLGGYVRGQITDPSGLGLESITVGSYQRALAFPNPNSSFDQPRTSTKRDGSFVLGPLATGEVHLSASTPDRKGSCEATLEVVEGGTYTWNDVIQGLPVITGRASDRSGEGLVGWTVISEAMSRPGAPPRAAQTGEDGKFEMTMSGKGKVRLKLFPPERPEHSGRMWVESRAPEAWVDGVDLDAKNVRIVLNAEQEPRATLRGRLSPPLGADTPKTLLKVYHEQWHEIGELEFPEGTSEFALPRMPAGRLSLVFEPVGFAKIRRNEIQLSQDEDLDLGDISIQRAGELSVVIRREDGDVPEGLDVSLLDLEGKFVYGPRSADRFEVGDLAEGSYLLKVVAQDCGPVSREITVKAEETARVEVVLASGGSIGLVFAESDDQPLQISVTVRVRDGHGELFFDEVLSPRENGHVSQWIFAPHGELSLEASLQDGRTIETTVPFAPGDPTGTPRVFRF